MAEVHVEEEHHHDHDHSHHDHDHDHSHHGHEHAHHDHAHHDHDHSHHDHDHSHHDHAHHDHAHHEHATVEEVKEGEEAGDVPELIDNAVPEAEEEEAKKASRSEKKSKKAMAKLGMKPVTGIYRVTLRKAKNILFVISQPEVYKSPNTDTYIIFGEAKIEDMANTAAKSAAKKFEGQAAAKGEASVTPAKIEEVVEEAIDDSGILPKDIQLVMDQTKVTRAVAIKAIRAHNNDIVNAIMSLTKT